MVAGKDVTSDDLFNCVLGWDPEHPSQTPTFPPWLSARIKDPQPLPSTFSSVQRYKEAILPVFMQEVWSSVMECESDPAVTVVLEKSVPNRIDAFLTVRLTTSPGLDFFLCGSDIVTLTDGDGAVVFAQVKTYHDNRVLAKLRLLRSSADRLSVTKGDELTMRKQANLSTSMRELEALAKMDKMPLCNDILVGRSTNITVPQNKVLQAIRSYKVNDPQAVAIVGAMDAKGFVLVQGPPGTGKTTTIRGLVGSALSATPKKKLLICAPSNAATDEVCKRLLKGVFLDNGTLYKPNVVRVGVETSVDDAVQHIHLDQKFKLKVTDEVQSVRDASTAVEVATERLNRLLDLEETYNELPSAEAERRTGQTVAELEMTFNHLFPAVREQLENDTQALGDAQEKLSTTRQGAQDKIIREADVVCATLSSSGHRSLWKHRFDTVIIDEAAQASEPSCLIPLRYGCTTCIMIGDPNQLPPTVLSFAAQDNMYDRSLFERLSQQKSSNVHLLSIQYRMNPTISRLPSELFYDGRLQDSAAVQVKTMAPWHQQAPFGPYMFFDARDGDELKVGTSHCNHHEALAAVNLYNSLRDRFGPKDVEVGVISMYKEQITVLQRAFSDAFGPEILHKIDFKTVDGFQGQEKDVIILSCVRTTRVGFLRDVRRMNVSFTRARCSLFVLGHVPTLESDAVWCQIVADARDRGLLKSLNANTFAAAKIPLQPTKQLGSNGYARPARWQNGNSWDTPSSDNSSEPSSLGTGKNTKSNKKSNRSKGPKGKGQKWENAPGVTITYVDPSAPVDNGGW